MLLATQAYDSRLESWIVRTAPSSDKRSPSSSDNRVSLSRTHLYDETGGLAVARHSALMYPFLSLGRRRSRHAGGSVCRRRHHETV